jgi:hypothetical protein
MRKAHGQKSTDRGYPLMKMTAMPCQKWSLIEDSLATRTKQHT